ncbi:tetratricopeptide repeat protein [Desulfogranum mediterraneum]|uniref:tetratricopeptide repeat protein n=1 Tax=Desulfogranum mediterraneum TaxID=160661 RepID=UPI00040A7544|nr:SEL1-like repeat protein [Desulfogranum mediterraneum]
MYELTSVQLLVLVHGYLFLAAALATLSAASLLRRYRSQAPDREGPCPRSWRSRALVALPLILSCLAILAIGLFALGLSHGSRPQGYQVVFFVLGCLLPVLLLLIWVVGHPWLDGFWLLLISLLLGYLLWFKPASYVQFWAESRVPWVQLWLARHYESGQGGLAQSHSRARHWYTRAAQGGAAEAQYLLAMRARRHREALRWYRLAAEQGHPRAMVQLARRERSAEERQRWLELAVDKGQPEALFILAEKSMATDLDRARELLLEAAEKGSRPAMLFLAGQYLGGGLLFARDEAAADHWLEVLAEAPALDTEPVGFSAASLQQDLAGARARGERIKAGDGAILYQEARRFLGHPVRDGLLLQRARDYLVRAAEQGQGAAALALAQLADSQALAEKEKAARAADAISAAALGWYRRAADLDNLQALEILARYFKAGEEADQEMLVHSLAYNQRLLELLPRKGSGSRQQRQRFRYQHWLAEYRDSERRLARLRRLDGSWQAARRRAEVDPDQEYLLAMEMLSAGRYSAGIAHLRSAAGRNDSQARLALARRTLRGPRSFAEEVAAVTTLQALDRQGLAAASLQLGALYQAGTGMVPRNYYLARQGFERARADPELRVQAERWLARLPAFSAGLRFAPGDEGRREALEEWYHQARAQGGEQAALDEEYLALEEHLQEIAPLRQGAEAGDPGAQYGLAQLLQSHELAQALAWLERAAEQGEPRAQYELAVRMIRGKKNSPQQQEAVRQWATRAAEQGHPGAMVFLATRYKKGAAGFKRDLSLARRYYQQALAQGEGERLYQGRIAGRSIIILRVRVQQALAELEEELGLGGG